MRSKFPDGFYFGAATASHQVEGGNKNDWTEWEHANARRLSQIADRKSWEPFILKGYPNPLQEENYISGNACDHYHRYEEDFDIAKSLCHNAHRFSIEWSRIEPEEGKFDEKEVGHYRGVVRALRARGMEPFATLWHWTLPLWFVKKGGWVNKDSAQAFARYAEHMCQALPEVHKWITLNEPNVYTGHGYWRGIWPPGKRSLRQYFSANYHLSQAHILAYRKIKACDKNSQVGIAQNLVWFTRTFSGIKRFVYNHLFLRSIRDHQDFIGVNYYHSDRATARRSEFQNWPIDPEGLTAVILEMKRYGKPVYVTENGIADVRDTERGAFIKSHLQAIMEALRNGADVRGYLYWSLLDNFEWSSGFWPRFGLVEINYKTLERKIRPSAFAYKDIIENGLPNKEPFPPEEDPPSAEVIGH